MWFPNASARQKSDFVPTRQRPFGMGRGRRASTRLSLESLEDRCLLSRIIPNDPRFDQQWGLEVTEAPRAWEITTGSTQVTVAVADTGIDYTHPDLYRNIWLDQEEIPSAVRPLLQDVDSDGLITFWDLNEPVNQGPGKISDLNGTGYIDGGDLLRPLAEGGWADGLDNGGNGYVDDLIGWDFWDNDNDPMDPSGHGTAVAGVIGAVGNNGEGVAGINWRVQVMPSRITLPRTSPDQEAQGEAAFLGGFSYAMRNGARVVNLSLGAPTVLLPQDFIDATSTLFDEAVESDVLIAASAGNDSLDTDVSPQLPSADPHDNIVSVAATEKNEKLANYSNFGLVSVDLGAPGTHIWTTELVGTSGPNDYGAVNGTSFAAPHVAGAAALILAVNPNLHFGEVKALILDNVDPLEDLAGKTVSGGRLNIYKAVSAALEERSGEALEATPSIAMTSTDASGSQQSRLVAPANLLGNHAASQTLVLGPISWAVSPLRATGDPGGWNRTGAVPLVGAFFPDEGTLTLVGASPLRSRKRH